MDIIQILEFSMKKGASDLHLSSGSPPMIRVHGEMKKLNIPHFSKDDVHYMIYDIMNDDQKKRFEENKEIDFSCQLGEIG